MNQKNFNFDYVAKNLLAGGVAGMCSKTVVAPLDRIKILLQAQNPHHTNHGFLTGLRHVYKHESFLAFYKGNGAQMVRIFPYAATQFTAFEIYKKYLSRVINSKSNLDKFLAGSLAGVTAVCITYPLDTIRARLAYQITGEHIYAGIVHVAQSIFQQEGGIKAIYRGFLPTVIGMVPYAGLSFYCFETLKFLCIKHLPYYTANSSPSNTGSLVLNVPSKLICGAFAGAIAQSFSYPFDVTRRRMQLAMMNPKTYKYGLSMSKTMLTVYKENGLIQGLYRGMSINYIRAVPMVSISFCTYELMKQILQLDTGIKI